MKLISLYSLLMIGFGGFVGSVLRYLVSIAMVHVCGSASLPWATLSINVFGSFIIGVLVSLGTSGSLYWLCVVGFCGGFTTFSTFSLETIGLIRAGNSVNAIIYILASIITCLLAVALGIWLGTRIGQLK